ncbi:ABC transporter ATP-binding protein [Haladaptatus salinisoli]|uniref:ABC transporter ATP-binding protein n=1 Tax=Haladaptatus salinisoli TaxID=2884876 RepID=UPI001D0A1610|nr:ABC transporter ATP-binding protein [Haladaptatus salinisoli]
MTASESETTRTESIGVESEGTVSETDPSDTPLRVDDLRKTFGGITAVDGATFSVEQGSLTGLIGPNGAGKSTTFNLITGVHTPDGGSVRFDGEDITGLRPYQIANRGLVRTFQIARELSEMTVLENMMLAPAGQSGEKLWRSVTPGFRGDVRREEEAVLERAWEMLEFFEIDHLAEEYSGNLSGGQRKLLEMARALMTDPKMVLLDEPLAGVNPSLEKKLLAHVHELRENGYTFLLVEHDMDVIMNNCERVIVMHQGKVLAEGRPEAIRANDRVIDAYLGEEI